MKPTRVPRRLLTLADVTILQPAIGPNAERSPMRGAEVAQLLAAAEALNLTRTGHQGMVLDGVAELLRVTGDAVDEDCWHATSKSAWLLAALLDGVRLAMTESAAMTQNAGARYEITVASAPRASRGARRGAA